MNYQLVIVVCVLAANAASSDPYRLTDGFLVGAGTSAYQTEGAWNESGKGESVLDYIANHLSAEKYANSTLLSVFKQANVASDSYHHVKDDISILKQLNFSSYRFSLSWARILPTGDTQNPNQAGIDFYNDLLDRLQAENIEPMVSLFHFDVPQAIGETYEWTDDVMVDAFVSYAEFAFSTFRDKVRYWVSVNEPDMFCRMFWEVPVEAGLKTKLDNYEYRCARNTLLAHGRAYRAMQSVYNGTALEHYLGLSVSSVFGRPNSTKYEDVLAADRYNAFTVALYLDPLVRGNFPEVALSQVAKKSAEENRTESRLPSFSTDEQELLAGSLDFIGLNVYYGLRIVDATGSSLTAKKQIDKDADVRPTETIGGIGGFDNAFTRDDSWVMRDSLLYIQHRYGDEFPIFITENGYSTSSESTDDPEREAYFSAYLRAMTKTINEYNVNVKGYYAWSFVDSFEWSRSFTERLGIVRVDISSANRTRTARDSAYIFSRITREWTVPYVEWPSSETESAAGRALPTFLHVLVILGVLILTC